MPEAFEPHVPAATGHAALAELDRVAWHELAHCYGTGKVGTHLTGDLRATLALLATPDPACVELGLGTLWANACHQGTIYPATAHAVPFVAAFAAGDVWAGWRRQAVVLLGHIAIASSFESVDGSTSGFYGDDVGDDTRAAFRACAALLAQIATHAPTLAAGVAAISACVGADPPRQRHLDALAEQLAALEAVDDGDPPRSVDPAPEAWVSHPKFGVGLVVGRQDDKTTVRFVDAERTIANRFLVGARPPTDRD